MVRCVALPRADERGMERGRRVGVPALRLLARRRANHQRPHALRGLLHLPVGVVGPGLRLVMCPAKAINKRIRTATEDKRKARTDSEAKHPRRAKHIARKTAQSEQSKLIEESSNIIN